MRHFSSPRAVFVVTALLSAAASTAAPDAERQGIWNWSGVPRVVAVGDLHGSYEKFVRLIKGAELVDKQLSWIGGEDHLVVAGDFLDRGEGGRELMDLLMSLEEQAPAAGGRVHVLLGNHEAMNLMRDTRYVNGASFLDFAADESLADREAAWKRYFGQRARTLAIKEARAEFKRRYPEGFFGRQKMLDLGGKYGDWLRTLPAIVKVNGVLYLHGGLTAEFAALGIDGINRRIHDELRRILELRRELEAAGVVTPEMNFTELAEAASAETERRRSAMAQTAAAFLEATTSPILGAGGPLWYRGTSLEDERIELVNLERSLELLDADRMVVAHTPTGGNKITTRFHGRLYRVDHGIASSQRPLALVVERDSPQVLDAENGLTVSPVPELPNGRSLLASSAGLDASRRQSLLRSGPVTYSIELGRGSSRPRLVLLERNGSRVRGVFKTVQHRIDETVADRYQHEVAAYVLDQILGLGMVPFTVEREIDGETGSLQAWIEDAVDHEAAMDYELDLYEGEATARQLARAELFDALIGNTDRKPSDVLCLLKGERVFLIDHSKAFSTVTEVAWGPSPEGAPDPIFVSRLRSLDRRVLGRKLGKLLAEEQIEAVLARRDLILDRLESENETAERRALVSKD